jgi:alcohol dehydrogenase
MAHFALDIPRRILIGAGSFSATPDECKALGFAKPLVVSDPFHEECGRVGELVDMLESAGVGSAVYAGVTGEPDTEMVDAGLAVYREERCDGIIALGGGSPIDAAKTINILLHNDGPVNRYMGLHKVPKSPTGIIAVPTTAGTGSEATKVVVITDAAEEVKMMCLDRAFLPAAAIVDYELTTSMPPELTAAVGLDALTHAVEGYVSKKANAFTDPIAVSSVKLIGASIGKACADGSDEAAREDMMLGAFQAGVAFSNSSVCLVHGMSRPIGACFHVPHGLSNAMLLPAVTRFSISGAPERYARLARVLDLADDSTGDEAACGALVDFLESLNRDLGVKTPSALGIEREDYEAVVEKMASDALASGSPNNNPRVPTAAEIVEIYRQAY